MEVSKIFTEVRCVALRFLFPVIFLTNVRDLTDTAAWKCPKAEGNAVHNTSIHLCFTIARLLVTLLKLLRYTVQVPTIKFLLAFILFI
jgi:hypothetical protein